MLILAVQISLICLAIHALFWEGMILYRIGFAIELGFKKYVYPPFSKFHKPLFSCLICMSSFWTIVSYFVLYQQFDLKLIPLMLMVCGLNVTFDSLIYYFRNGGK